MAKKQIPTPQDVFKETRKIPTPEEVLKKKVGDDVSESLEEPISTDEKAKLTFEEEKMESAPNFMGLFGNKDKNKKIVQDGVSVSFAEKVSDAAKRAERPLKFINRVNYAEKRIQGLKENFPDKSLEIGAVETELNNVNSQNIDLVEEQLNAIEESVSYKGADVYGQPLNNPEWNKYYDEVVRNPVNLAVSRLQEDNDKLRSVATGSDVSPTGEAIKSMPTPGADIIGGIVEAGEAVVEGKTENLGKGIASGVKQYVEGYTEFTDELLKNKAIRDLMKKQERIDKGEDVEWTTDDRLLAQAVVENAKLHEELDSEIPYGFKVGEAIGHSLGFMGEFVLTGGGAGAVGKKVATGLAKATATRAGRLGVGMAIKLSQAGIQTAKMPSLYQKTAINVSNGMDFLSGFGNAYWETFGETFSERVFLANPVSGKVANATDGILRRMGINFNVDKGGVGVVKNILEESAEEKVGEIVTAPKDYENFKDFWQGFTDEEQNKVMLGSVAGMVGTMGSLALAGNKVAEARRKSRLAKLEKVLPTDLRAEIDAIYENKDLTIQQKYDLVANSISDRIDSEELGEDPTTTTANAMRYANYLTQQEAAEAADENVVVENGEFKVGETEEIGTMQEQMDFLQERGVEIPDGSTAEDVSKLYESEKNKRDDGQGLQEEEMRKTEPRGEEAVETGEKDDTEAEATGETEQAEGAEITVNEATVQKQYGKKVRVVPTEVVDQVPRGVTNEDVSEAKEKIRDDGTVEPLILTYYPNDNAVVLSDGHHRLAAAKEMGITDIPIKVNVSWSGSVSESNLAENTENLAPPQALNVEKYKKENYSPSVISPTEIGFAPTEAVSTEKGVTPPPGQESVSETPKQPSKKEIRQQRIAEIDAELGEEIENLVNAIGGLKKAEGGERQSAIKAVQRIADLHVQKFALKGQALVDAVVDYFKAKGVELDDELKQNLQEYAKETEKVRPKSEGAKQKGKPVGGVREGDGAKTAPEEKKRQFGEKVLASTKLPADIKKAVRKNGIGYIPRGRRITGTEAKELIRLYEEEGGMDKVKAEIMNTGNLRIFPDTRTAMATAYVQRMIDMSNKEVDPDLAAEHRKNASDIMYFVMKRSTGVAQELESMKMWNNVLGTHPEFIRETVRSYAEEQNQEFYDNYSEDIDKAKGIIDKFLNSKEFKDKYQKRREKETVTQRRERGKAKIANALDRLATMRGVKKNAVSENEINDNEFKVILDIADGILDIGVASVEDLLNGIKVQVRSYFTPSEIERAKNRIVKATNAKERLQKKTTKIKLDKKTEDQLVDELFDKIVIATKSQLRRLIADNIELFQRQGVIDDRSFRELMAKAIGKEYVTEEQLQKVEDAARQINDATNIGENIDKLFDEYEQRYSDNAGKAELEKLKKEIKNQVKLFKEAMFRAGLASKAISDVFAESPTTVKLLASNIQGNLLTPASLKVNVVAYAFVGVRAAKNVMATMLDAALSGLGVIRNDLRGKLFQVREPHLREVLDQMFAVERTFASTGINRGMFRGFASGTREGVRQMWYGQATEDMYRRDIGVAIKPFHAWYDMYQALKGEEKLRVTQLINRFISGTLGMPPEIMFRLLNLGDKPFRRAAEQARLQEIAEIKKDGIIKDFLGLRADRIGLEGKAKENYIKNPSAEDKRAAEQFFKDWRDKFMIRPDEESAELARESGLKASYQNDNVITNMLKTATDVAGASVRTNIDWVDKALSSLGRIMFVANMPYVKTPTNILLETFDYTMAPIPMAKAMWNAVQGNRREFVDNAAKAIVATMINSATWMLFQTGVLGLASGGEEEEPKKGVTPKVRAFEYEYRPPYYLNDRAMTDLMRNLVYGENNDLAWRDGDAMSSYQRYGQISSILMAHAQAYRGMSEEEMADLGFLRRQTMLFQPIITSGLDQSFVQGISAAYSAIRGSDYEQERYLVNMTRALSATAVPNTYRSYIQARENTIKETRNMALDGWDRKKNTMKNDFQSSFLLDNNVPAKISIWGEDIERYKGNQSVLGRLFDIEKERIYGDKWGIELFNIYRSTGKSEVIPPLVDNRVRVLDKDVKVGGELYENLSRYVGSTHKMYTKHFVENTYFPVEVGEGAMQVSFNNLQNDLDKVELLERFYRGSIGNYPTRSELTKKFISDHRYDFLKLYEEQHGKTEVLQKAKLRSR